jgi:predicted dinucleotide-binding enzyme
MVGQTLAGGFLHHGYGVVMGTRNPDKKISWPKQAGSSDANALSKIRVTTYAEAAKAADLAVLATKGTAAEAVVREVGPHIRGKIVMDTTNPIADAPPENGVLKFFTTLDDSLMERLQRIDPDALLVKCFSSVGSGLMVNPQVGGVRPTMFICGNDPAAKQQVAAILDQFGWDAEDMGSVGAARAIEPLCILWCIPGFLRNEWSHAFKLLR